MSRNRKTIPIDGAIIKGRYEAVSSKVANRPIIIFKKG